MPKKLTVVVCTRNRAELLRDCLQSLAAQTVGAENYDVLVVDNASTDNTKEVINDLCSKHSNFRYALESKTGLSHARNYGFRNIETEWVAYIDDDAKAAPDWVEKIMYSITHYDFDAFGGIYLPWYRFGKKKWMNSENFFSNKSVMPLLPGELKKEFFSGGNCAFRVSALNTIGGFNTEIGMRANVTSYGEETLVQVRLRELKMRIGFDPSIIIYHAVLPYKLNLRWFFKARYRNGLDHWETFSLQPMPGELRKIFVRGTKNFIRNFFTLAPRLFRKDYYFQNWVIDVFCEYARVWGVVKGGRKKMRKV